MKKLSKENLSQIMGGCFCYCNTNPFKAYMPYIFVKEVDSEAECRTVCNESRSLPYFGYSKCLNGFIHLDHDVADYPQQVVERLNYINGGWRSSDMK